MQRLKRLKADFDIILDKIDEIINKDELNIHDMADLARYSKSLKNLAETEKIIENLENGAL